MLRISFILIFLTFPLFAVDSIYTWGYGEDMREILTSMKFFTQNSAYLIDAAIAVALVAVILNGASEDMMDRTGKVILMSIFISQMFFHHGKDYLIEDEVTNQTFAVTDIPIGTGELLNVYTSIERVLTRAFESAYSTPNSLKFSESGLGFSMNAHLNSSEATFLDGYKYETFMDYTSNCITAGMIDGQISKNLIYSENLVDDLRVTGYETIVFDRNGSYTQMSCQNSYDNHVKPAFQNESNSFIENRIATKLAMNKGDVDTGLQATSSLFFGVTKSGQDYVMQHMAKNMLNKGLHVMAMTTGGDTQALAYGSAISDASVQNQWQQTGIQAQKTLPMIKAFITVIIVALIPILALFSIMFGDWKHLKMINTLFLTIVLFTPLASLINNLMYIRLERILQPLSQGMFLPMATMRDVDDELFSYLNFLGWVSMFIPMFSYAIAKASEMGFVNFMGALGGAVTSGATQGATQKTTGANLGNTRVGQGTVVGDDGTTTAMGGGAYQLSGIRGDGESTYSFQTYQDSLGNSYTNATNAAGNFTANNGEMTTSNLTNFSADIASSVQSAYGRSLANEQSTLETLSNTLSSGLTQSMASGQIKTNAEELAQHTGMSMSDAKTVSSAYSEAVTSTLATKLSEAQSNGNVEETGFRLNGQAGWSSDGAIKSITGIEAGINGAMSISGTTTDGQTFSIDMSKDDSQQFNQQVSEQMSQTFTKDEGLTQRVSDSLADNQVFSDTSLKSDMEAYTQADQRATKYSENFNENQSDSSSIVQKMMPQVVQEFIAQDEALKHHYQTGDDNTKLDTYNKAMIQMDQAFKDGSGANYNRLNSAFSNVTGMDLKGNLAGTVQQQLEQGAQKFDQNDTKIDAGQQTINKTEVNNTISSADTDKKYENTAQQFEQGAQERLQETKEESPLNTKETITKTGDLLDQRRDDFNNQSDVGKSLEAIAGRTEDIYDGVFNKLNEATTRNNTDYDEFRSPYSNEEIGKIHQATYDKAVERGLITDNVLDDSIKDQTKLDQFNHQELYALLSDGHSYFHLDEPSREMVKSEILSREASTGGNQTNFGNSNVDLESIRANLPGKSGGLDLTEQQILKKSTDLQTDLSTLQSNINDVQYDIQKSNNANKTPTKKVDE
jgi:conjugal transfer mating pair stabilization protein TraG